MAAFSHREGVLLSFNHPISAPQSPDIDFRDVFGGPPRRASIQETRFAKDAFEFGGEEEAISRRRQRWSGLSERPVFGEEGGNRRRNGRDVFFDDIFGGNDSSSSSPRDTFNSNHAPKILSPGRPISSRFSEPLLSSQLPSQLSAPRKSINQHKNRDGKSNGLFTHSPLSRSSSQAQESRNSASSRSSLSRETSPISEESEILEQPEEAKKDKNLKKDSTDSRVQSAGHQFHFSIYRWASKRMPLPCRGGRELKTIEPFKLEKSSSPSGRITCEGMGKESPAVTENRIASFCDTVSSDASSCEIEPGNSKNSSNVSEGESEPVEDEISPVNSNFQDLKAEEGQVSTAVKEALKSSSKKLRSLFSGNNGAKEPEENVVKSTRKSSAASEKQSKQDVKRMLLNNEETGKADAQGTHISSQDKIKEFLKIYDQETSGPSELKETSQSRSFSWKDIVKIRTSNDRILPTANLYEDLPRTAATEKVDALPKKPEKRRSLERTNNYKPNNIASDSEGRSASTEGSIHNGSEARDEHLGDSFHENMQITELTQDEAELQQAGNIEDEIQAIDANIRKWSQGKEGNIRSLLSTLQFVLWPESGWKPVPLVDIIEANAVKKSYQKALLSLHPDKLQQKGATLNQKYIAEKVFDILQEAWTHFNTLGSL